MTRRGDKIAEVQAAVDIEAAKKELRGLLKKADQNQYDADRSRLQAGQLLLRIRKTIPAERGPKAKEWGDLCQACGISLDTAARYMKVADYVAANPDALDGKSFGKVYEACGIGKPGWEQSYPQGFPQAAENVPPRQSAAELPPPTETPALPAPAPLPTKSAKPPTRTIYDRGPGGGDEGAQEEYGDGLEERQLDDGGERIPLFPGEPAAEALRDKRMEAPPKAPVAQAEFVWERFRDEVSTYVEIFEEQCPTFLRQDLGDLLIAEGQRLKEDRP